MHHRRFATIMAGTLFLAMSSPAFAQTPLPLKQKKDMACYVGLSILSQEAQKSDKMNAIAKQNISASIFYYAGKIAARHPGKAIPALVNSHIKEVTDHIKTTNAKACLDEVKIALKSNGAK